MTINELNRALRGRINIADRFALSARHVTDEGYLIAPGALARTGIYEYQARELGLDGTSRVIRLYRPPEEVFAPDAMASFEGQPVTLDHPPGFTVTARNWQQLAKGEVRGIARDQDMLTGTLTIRAKDAIAQIESGKAELSNGYTFMLDETPGTAPDGTAYDGIQRQIRGNHVAIVDRARGGERCRIADGVPPSTPTQPPTQTLKGKAMTTRKVTIDGVPLEVEPNAAEVIETLQKQRNTARDALQTAQSEAAKAAELKTALDTALAQIDTLKKQVLDEAAIAAKVAELATALDDAHRFAPSLATDGKSADALRRETLKAIIAADSDGRIKAVSTAVLGGKEIDAADAALVASALTAVRALLPNEDATATLAKVGDALLHTQQTVADHKPTGRWAFIARQSGAWKTAK